jgi:8-oxo-dGTP diphosphatase
MSFEVGAELVLKHYGRPVLDGTGCAILEAVRDLADPVAMAKRLGITTGDLAGTVDSLNGQFGSLLCILEADGYHLTKEGEEAVSEFRLKEHMLDEQLRNLWKKPWITTDGVVLMGGKLVLIRRGREPFKGMYALPGGIVEYGESLEQCVVREMREETGLETNIIGLVGAYSTPGRDPRGHYITIAFNLRHIGGSLLAGDDAEGAAAFPLDDLPELAFDHAAIIKDALTKRGDLR